MTRGTISTSNSTFLINHQRFLPDQPIGSPLGVCSTNCSKATVHFDSTTRARSTRRTRTRLTRSLSVKIINRFTDDRTNFHFQLTQDIEFPDQGFTPECRDLLEGLLKREVHERLGCRGKGQANKDLYQQNIYGFAGPRRSKHIHFFVDWTGRSDLI